MRADAALHLLTSTMGVCRCDKGCMGKTSNDHMNVTGLNRLFRTEIRGRDKKRAWKKGSVRLVPPSLCVLL